MTGHLSENELIAFQLGETANADAMAAHLEDCSLCAAAAESIAETLRVFSGDAVPEANLDHAWQRLRGSLPPLAAKSAPPQSRRSRRWLAQGLLLWTSGAALAACLLGVGVLHRPHGTRVLNPAALQPGPLTASPRDPNVSAHLSDAERLLTEIDHASGSLDEATRERAAELLVTNALYVERAERDGDTAQASVLEQLGRTLTSVEHEPAEPRKGWNLRMEMNTSGLLLDIRILQQNDAEPALSQPARKERP